MVVLSFDPGRLNFAWVASEFHQQGQSLEQNILGCGVLDHTVQTLNDSQVMLNEMRNFTTTISSMLSQYNPTAVAIERYMTRGKMVGVTAETANIGIGLITFLSRRCADGISLISSATWKSAYNREVTAFVSKRKALDEAYAVCRIEPHELDAALIGHYCAASICSTKPYWGTTEMKRDNLINQLEALSKSKQTNRRLKRRYGG